MSRKQKYIEHLESKFGLVTDILLDKENCALKTGSDQELYYHKGAKDANRVMVARNSSDDFADQKGWKGKEPFPGWAFDFPGWIGSLNFNKDEAAKEIMVVGLEPHIQNRFYQVTYGLRECSPGYLNSNDKLFHGKNLHQNLKAMFGHEGQNARAFYEQFYITDMCFFAPMGNAGLIKDVHPKWGNKRAEIASKFLREEIELIKPKIIVSSGSAVASFIDNKILKDLGEVQDWKEPNMGIGNFKYLPFLTIFKVPYGKVIHAGLPHIASPQTQSFWTVTNLDKLRTEIEKLI